MFNRKWFFVVAGSTLAILLLAGLFSVMPAYAQGGGMMGNRGHNSGFGPGGMMGQPFNNYERGGFFGPGWMMQNTQGFSGTNQFGPGWMMGNFFNGDGGFGGGMRVNTNNAFYIAPPRLSVDEARAALNEFVAGLNDPNLKVVDIMIFDNHAYAQVVEQDSGIGVLEVLVDPVTKSVYPEMGPTMMWNQKYGMTLAPARSAGVSGYGHYGMMGGFFNGPGGGFTPGGAGNPPAPSITPEQAVTTAQSYLDANFAPLNLTVLDHVTPFYGYYTLHVQQDGQTVGMLGVNGFTGTVWPHTWHGKFLEVSME